MREALGLLRELAEQMAQMKAQAEAYRSELDAFYTPEPTQQVGLVRIDQDRRRRNEARAKQLASRLLD